MKKLYVAESKVAGKGIFLCEAAKKGDRICFVKGKEVVFIPTTKKESASIPTWFGITKNRWIDPTKTIFRFFNHSCSPNTAITGTRTVIARKNINKDEEITIDYSMTDCDFDWELTENCGCGSSNCRKRINSIQHLSPSVVRAHMPLIPKYFQNIYKKTHPNVSI